MLDRLYIAACAAPTGGGEVLAFAVGVVFGLVAVDAAEVEVIGIGVPEVGAGDGGAGPYGVAFDEANAGLVFDVEQIAAFSVWLGQTG